VVMTICGLVFGLSYLLMSQVYALWQLYVFYGLLIGVGMSGGMVPMMSTAARWFTKRRGLLTGIVLSGVGVGTMISPPVVSRLISSYGWRTADIYIGIVFLVMLVVVSQFLKRDPGKIGQLPYGADHIERAGSTPEVSGFSLREALHTKQLWMLFVMYICLGTSQMAVMVHIVPHATDLGISPIAAANIMTIIGALSLTGRVVLGGVADRIGSKRALIIGLALMSVALFLLQSAKELWMFYPFAALFGFGYGGDVALISLIVADLFGLRAHGAILGVVSFAYTIGCATGPLLAGRIYDVSGSYYLAFWVFAALCVVGLVILALLKPTREGSSAV